MAEMSDDARRLHLEKRTPFLYKVVREIFPPLIFNVKQSQSLKRYAFPFEIEALLTAVHERQVTKDHIKMKCSCSSEVSRWILSPHYLD